jgi:hypothetical protein
MRNEIQLYFIILNFAQHAEYCEKGRLPVSLSVDMDTVAYRHHLECSPFAFLCVDVVIRNVDRCRPNICALFVLAKSCRECKTLFCVIGLNRYLAMKWSVSPVMDDIYEHPDVKRPYL